MYLLFLIMASKVNGVYAASKLPWTASNPHGRDDDIACHPFDSRAADRSPRLVEKTSDISENLLQRIKFNRSNI